MVKRFVLDTSVALSLVFPDERTDATIAFWTSHASARIHVPSLWLVETTNALIAAERRKRLTMAQVRESWLAFDALRLTISRFPATVPQAREVSLIAANSKLTGYDAVYLGLAQSLGVPLATLDADLLRAARAADVPTIHP